MFADTVGHFFRASQKEAELPELRIGGTYRHSGPGNIIETARVLEVGPDPMGIPHVRFEVLVEQSQVRHNRFATVRTLNLHTFRSHFVEEVMA